MLVEARVFAGDEGLLQARRRVFDGNRNAPLFAKYPDQPAIRCEYPERDLQLNIAQRFDVGQIAAIGQPGCVR